MKKILSAVVAALVAAQFVVYAETDANTNNTANGDIELFAMPTEQITATFNQEQVNDINDAIEKVLEDAYKAEDEYVQVPIPESIEIDESNANAMFGIATNYLADHPEYFYLDQSKMSYVPNTNSLNINYKDKYKLDAEEIQDTQSRIDETVYDIIMQMESEGVDPYSETAQTDFDRALWLHDYLADTITYDMRAYLPALSDFVERGIDAALLDDRLTVCEGYANAYKYILEKIGMECVNVYSDTEHHEWSAVKIGDAWYYVDVTQDDHDNIKNIRHDFFLVTKDELEITSEHESGEQLHGTHHDGYITEIDESKMVFGDDYEGAPWHGNFQGEGQNREWYESVVNSRVVFNGDDRYYCNFDADEEDCSFVYKCGADLNDAEKFCKIDDGIWYVVKETERPRYDYEAFYGGLGKYTYAATSDDEKHSGKSYLYFNSPNAIYELCLDDPEAEIEPVYEYTPKESESVNCMLGMSVRDNIEYMTADLSFDEGIQPDDTETTQIACNVRFYVTVDTLLLSGILTYPYGTSIDAPGPEMYGKIVKLTNLSDGSVWEYNKPITESVRLNWSIESIQWPRISLRASASSNGIFVGGLDAGIDGFDEAYCEAPVYTLAVYEDGALKAVKRSENGKFTFTADENIPYTIGSTEVKIYAWSNSLVPYLDGAKVHISLPSGDGNEEEGNEEDNGGDDIDTDTTDSE